MNKRRRELLAALTPAVEFALKQAAGPAGQTKPRDIPGFHMRARVSAEAPAELMIYGQIGASWYGDGVTAVDVANALKEAGPGPINVRLNSGGGDVFQGVAIHTLLARHPGTITVDVDGLAASAASFIMLAGDLIRAARNAFVMIHDGMTSTYGNRDTHQRAMDLLDKVSANIADMYAERAGEDIEYWRNLMTVNGEDGTWYTGLEALDAGLVDEVTEPADPEEEDAAVAARLSGHERLPEKVATFVATHLPADPDDDPDNADPEPTGDDALAGDPDSVPDSDEDFQFAMEMAHWQMTTEAASNGQAGETA